MTHNAHFLAHTIFFYRFAGKNFKQLTPSTTPIIWRADDIWNCFHPTLLVESNGKQNIPGWDYGPQWICLLAKGILWTLSCWLRSGYFFPRKLIINHKPLQRCQFVVRKRNKPYLKNWSLSTPGKVSLQRRGGRKPHLHYRKNRQGKDKNRQR